MIKLYIIVLIGFSMALLASTPEQVEQYLVVSNTEDTLLNMELQFSKVEKEMKKNDSNESSYDMQLLSIRFKEYLQKYISEDEMTDILNNYKNIALLRFISASSISTQENNDSNMTLSYVTKLKRLPDSNVRIGIISKINKNFYSEEAIMVLFDELMKPNLIKNGNDGQKINEKTIKEIREEYMKMAMESSLNQTLYACKEFTIEELDELLKIAKTPAVANETKFVYKAMAHALKKFIHFNLPRE